MASALLIDLDGVLRRWPTDVAAVPGLSPDVVRAALFEPELLHRAVTGVITDHAWRREAAASQRTAHGVECADRLLEGAKYPGKVQLEVLDIVRRVRRVVPVCLITNATSRLDDHLGQLTLTREFDLVCNSSAVGVAKPDPDIFRQACARLGCPLPDALFVDDTEGHVLAGGACITGTTDSAEKGNRVPVVEREQFGVRSLCS